MTTRDAWPELPWREWAPSQLGPTGLKRRSLR
jgi:hypothetical protein